MLTSTTRAYWDTSLATLLTDGSRTIDGFRIYNPMFSYSKSANALVDTNISTDNRQYAHNRQTAFLMGIGLARLESSMPCPSTPFAYSNELQFRIGSNAVGSVIHGREVVSIYPNPAHDVLNISFSISVKYAVCWLYDSFGRIVATAIIENGSATNIDISSFSPGLYLYRVLFDGDTLSGKVRKE